MAVSRQRLAMILHATLPGVIALMGCTAEPRLAGMPQGPVPQLTVTPTFTAFRYTAGGALPAPVTVDLTSSPGVLDGLEIGKINYSPLVPAWLDADFGNNLTQTPTSLTLTATPPSTLGPGTYVASVPLGSAVSGVVTQFVVATLTIDSIPSIGLSPGSVNLTVASGSNPANQFVSVSNAGSGSLTGLSLGSATYSGSAGGWLTASLSSNAAPALITLQVASAALPVGNYTAQLPVRSSIAGVPAETVTVNLGIGTIGARPTIALSPSILGVTATTGGANPAQQQVQISNSGGGTLSGLRISSITYPSGAAGWLSASLTATTAPARATLTFQTTALAAGQYVVDVQVASSLAGVAPATFRVNLTVSPGAQPPVMILTPTALAFTATLAAPNPPPDTVAVTNAGGGVLNLLTLGSIGYTGGQTGWLTAALSNTTAPANIVLTPTIAGVPAGFYTAQVPVLTGAAGALPETLTVALTVLTGGAPPSIGLAPTDVNFNGSVGGPNPPPTNVLVSNTGGGTLDGLALGTVTYTSGPVGGWLTASLNTTTAPATITVQPVTGTLVAGTYRALVPVTSPVASNAPRSIGVRFTVAGPPGITLSQSNVAFAGTTGAPNPAPTTVNITSSSTLAGLTAGPITYGAGEPTGWLSLSLSGGSTPAVLVLSAATGALSSGTFTATVPIGSTTPGVTPQALTVTFSLAAPSGTLVILQGNNQVGLVNSQLPAALRVRAVDASSLPRVGVPVVWSVGNGGRLTNVLSTTDASGEVTANWITGPVAGLHTLSVTSPGVPAVNFQADVRFPANPGQRANEPPGFASFKLTERPFLIPGEDGWFERVNPTLKYITDPSAPITPAGVVQFTFPVGQIDGQAPILISKTFPSSDSVYATWYEMWADSIFGGSKVFYFGMGNKFPVYMITEYGNDNGRHPVVAIHIQNGTPNIGGNQPSGGQGLVTGVQITTGVWHHIEVLIVKNSSATVADGTLKLWFDGVLVINRDPSNNTGRFTGPVADGIALVGGAIPVNQGISEFRFNPTYHHNYPPVNVPNARVWQQWVDDIYVSGK